MKQLEQSVQLLLLQDLGDRLHREQNWYSAVVIGLGDVPHLRIVGCPVEVVAATGTFDIWGMAPEGELIEGGFSQDGIVSRLVELYAKG